MAADNETRRGALKIIGAIGSTCAFPFSSDELYGQTDHHPAHALAQGRQAVPAGPRYFSEDDWKLISRLADLIIPGTDTPGALASGVPAYIDYVVRVEPQHQPAFREGLAWLQERSKTLYADEFLSLTEDQQIDLLTPLSDAVDANRIHSVGERFFYAVKSLTADGYFTSKIGLMDQLGYKGNALVPDFQGCTHEH